MPTVTLNGCAPVPLAHYLKALGILRLVAEQADAEARAFWLNDEFSLLTTLTPDTLAGFFLREYRPSPVLAPWNGGSGFFPKDNAAALAAIESSPPDRFSPYRGAIKAARRELKRLGLGAKPDGEAKAALLQSLRNSFPEAALGWLDAVVVLGQDGVRFPPLLGTGGNDGRLEFTNNFMQRLTEVLDPQSGLPTPESERWLRAALFAEAAPGLATKAPIGQFFPGAAGGANATSGFDGPSAVNPWDFILMIEGALLFAAASVKRLEVGDAGALVYPFCVRQAGIGYASAAGADETEARCEMWMPLWSEPAGMAELRAIFSEGRARIRGRAARTGVDFAQAAVTLGVDRGLAGFQRYGFQVRNGLAYFATPLDRIRVSRNARVDLLADLERWHDRLRQKAGPRANPEPPASISRALQQVERRIFELCRDDSPAHLQALLAALGAAERTLARSGKWTKDNYLHPLQGLRPEWLEKADDGSMEFRLAQSLAGMRARLNDRFFWLREQLEPVDIGSTREHSWANWAKQPSRDVAWHDGDLTEALSAILARRLVRVTQSGVAGWPDWSPRPATLADLSDFIEGRTNDALLADLIWGLSLLDWQRVKPLPAAPREAAAVIPSSLYALLRLSLRPAKTGGERNVLPVVPAILRRAMNGDGRAASEQAARRLRASGEAPLVASLPVAGEMARRTAAAVLFPIGPRDFSRLESYVLQPSGEVA